MLSNEPVREGKYARKEQVKYFTNNLERQVKSHHFSIYDETNNS